MPLPPCHEKHFIAAPLATRSRAATAHLIRIRLPKLPAPVIRSFLGQSDAAYGHELFDIARAEAEARMQLDTVADDLRRNRWRLYGLDVDAGLLRRVWHAEAALSKGEG